MRLRALPLTVLTLAALAVPLTAAAPTGTYSANGKAAQLAFAVALPHEPFSDQEALTVILSEKDPSKEKKPEFAAHFGRLGDALIVSFTKDGGIFGCIVVHGALKRSGASTIGTLKLEGLDWGTTVKGRLTTDGPASLFDETWEADLTFETPAPK